MKKKYRVVIIDAQGVHLAPGLPEYKAYNVAEVAMTCTQAVHPDTIYGILITYTPDVK